MRANPTTIKQIASADNAIFEVKFFDPLLSKKGQGVQVKSFVTREGAERFAQDKRLYARRQADDAGASYHGYLSNADEHLQDDGCGDY